MSLWRLPARLIATAVVCNTLSRVSRPEITRAAGCFVFLLFFFFFFFFFLVLCCFTSHRYTWHRGAGFLFCDLGWRLKFIKTVMIHGNARVCSALPVQAWLPLFVFFCFLFFLKKVTRRCGLSSGSGDRNTLVSLFQTLSCWLFVLLLWLAALQYCACA